MIWGGGENHGRDWGDKEGRQYQWVGGRGQVGTMRVMGGKCDQWWAGGESWGNSKGSA